MRGPIVRFLLLVLLALLLAPVASASTVEGGKSVLVLYSYHDGLQWCDSIQEGIESVFDGAGFHIATRIEYMDAKRIDSDEHMDNLLRTYRTKFRDRHFDLVLTVDNHALDFVLEHRPELFPGVPVVFCAVNDDSPGMLGGEARVTGVVEAVDFRGGVRTILQLQPDVKRIFAYGTPTLFWEHMRDNFLAEAREEAEGVDIVVMEDMNTARAREHLRTLGKNDAVLMTNLYADASGNILDLANSSRVITSAAPVPVYGFWDGQLGHGIVGGMLISGFAQGETAARMGLELLKGRPVSDFPVVTDSPNRQMVDYDQIVRTGLKPARIPEGSVVINEPVSLYQQYRREVWTGTAVIALLTTIIAALVLVLHQRRRGQKALQEQNRFLESLLGALPNPVFFKDVNGVYLRCNALFAEGVLGLSVDEVVGRTLATLDKRIPRERVEQHQSMDERLIRDRSMGGYEAEVRHTNGEIRHYHLSKAPIMDENGAVQGIIGVMLDITDRQENEALKQQLIEELESKNTELERFTYTVSHDLKSPIITIKGFIGMLERDLESQNRERVRGDLERIDSAASRMSQLLDELLELSRIGRMVNPSSRVKLGELAEEVAEAIAGRVSSCGGMVQIQDNLPEVFVDRVRIYEVLQNLMENGIKFSSEVECPLVEVGMKERQGEPVFYVQDNGVGIDPRFTDRVFNLFEKLDPSMQGTGIGLALVKRIVELHGGRVWVETEGLGSGTRVCFTLGPQCLLA